MKMMGLFLLFSLLPLLGLTVACQETFEIVHIHEPNSQISPPIAVSVSKKDLPLVSSSVLSAEVWLKSNVLAKYPSTNITTIVVGRGMLCNKQYRQQWHLILPSVKNIYHSIMRWGLLKEIKVSAAFSSDCFDTEAQNTLKPLLSFLQGSNLPYVIYPSQKTNMLISTYQDSLEKLGFSQIKDIRVIKNGKTNLVASSHLEYLKKLRISSLREVEPMGRMLYSMNFPSFRSRNKRLPPPLQFAPAPQGSFPFAPDSSPTVIPPSPPVVPTDPPMPFCLPFVEAPAMPPATGNRDKDELWCVAKPTVPSEKLQEAMDFACGEGGADCEEIRPNGNCFNPDNLVAHASYAFNSYWQKTKQTGGSCSFDGTAILINSDPSFLQCRFELS